jgi:drug/metabolite transporter (DMT)-like permease
MTGAPTGTAFEHLGTAVRLSLPPGVLAILVAAIWGLCFVVIQASLPGAPPLLLAGLRAVIGGIVLAGWVLLRRWPAGDGGSASASHGITRRLPAMPSLPILLVLASTNAALAFGAMYLAAGSAEAAVASILAGAQPLILAAAGWALFGERSSARAGAGLLVAMAGVVMVATASTGTAEPAGIALASLAAAAPALGTVIMRRLASDIDLIGATSAQFLLGGVMLLGASAAFEGWSGIAWSPAMVAGTLLLGVLGTGVGYAAWFWLLDRMPLAKLGGMLFVAPIVGVTSGILLGDRPGPVAMLGIVALLLGIALVSLPPRPATIGT